MTNTILLIILFLLLIVLAKSVYDITYEHFDNSMVDKSELMDNVYRLSRKTTVNIAGKELDDKLLDNEYLNYLKARTKARSLNIQSTAKWKLYCHLNDTLPHGVPESPEIVYRNNGWVNFNDWLGIKVIKKVKNKRKTTKSRIKAIKLKPLDSVKNYKFSKLASKRLPNALNAVKLIGNLREEAAMSTLMQKHNLLSKAYPKP